MKKSKFIIRVAGVNYNCMRESDGKKVITQTISVNDVGSEKDTHEYGFHLPYMPLSMMQHFARIIAADIISKSKAV